MGHHWGAQRWPATLTGVELDVSEWPRPSCPERFEPQQYADVFARLCNVERIEPVNGSGTSTQSATVVSGDATIYLPLAGMIDVEAECKRLSADLDDVTAQINKTESTLGNENFVKRAKPEIVEREREHLL